MAWTPEQLKERFPTYESIDKYFAERGYKTGDVIEREEDEYFVRLGDVIEQHPIGRPRRRRGS